MKTMIPIHEAFNKAAIAEIYYQLTRPERNYTRVAAKKQFGQDRNIDLKKLAEAFNKAVKEQKELLNKYQEQLDKK